MSSSDEQTQEQTQESKTEPWAVAQPLLTSLINQYSGMSTGVTGAQQSALDKLTSAASSTPDFSNAATSAVGNLFNSSTNDQVGMLNSAYDQLKSNIGGVASGAELNPYDTPGFSDAIQTMMSDITNQVKGVYAGSGRAPSGAGSFAGSLGRGLTQGIAPTIASQYNTNNTNRLNAAGTLYGAGNTTASGITNQDQVELTNQQTGLNSIGALMSALTSGANTELGAANANYSQSYANLASLLSAATSLGGMGSSSAGSGTATTTQETSALSNAIGALATAAGLASSFNKSDERSKENIEPVGSLDDGQTIYRYNYKGDDLPQIGLLAQEVQEHVPLAVGDFGGLLKVNYRTATNRAAAMRKAA